MAQELRKIIGDPAVFAFQYASPRQTPPDVEGLAWGELVLWIGSHRIWANERSGILWTWIDLIEHLGQAWSFLLYEEVAPYGLVVNGPEQLRDHQLMKTVNGEDLEQVDEALFNYQHRHDLSAGLKGIYLPPVWVLPEGRRCRIRHSKRDTWIPKDDLIHVLTDVGDLISAQVPPDAGPRAERALILWQNRHPLPEEALRLRTGLGDAIKRWGEINWGDPLTPDDNPLMAAARLSAGLTIETRIRLTSSVRSVPHCDTPILDKLSEAAAPVLDALRDLKPYEQGYSLAIWLRKRLALGDEPADPASYLSRWGVWVTDLPPLEPNFDALAVWGQDHGPAVLLNPTGRFSKSVQGRRATLAHEILHLLVDREHHLPVAEVYGGATPLHLEQRAKAFAAEFLIPRTIVTTRISKSSNFLETFRTLIEEFGVSSELAGWQVHNSNAWGLLTDKDKRYVKKNIRLPRWQK